MEPYYKEDGYLDYKKYLISKIEKEANKTQYTALLNFNHTECGMKLLKTVYGKLKNRKS